MRTSIVSVLLLTLAIAAAAQAQNPATSNPDEITVDGDCRILTFDFRDPARPRLRRSSNAGICDLEGGVKSSLHWEATIQNGRSRDKIIEVVEREYVLHNPYPQRVTFLVKQQLLKKHQIDSDPKPDEIVGSVAAFHVVAEANQTVRLHVGERSQP